MTTVRYVIPGRVMDAAREADRTCAPGAVFAAAGRILRFLPRDTPGAISRRHADVVDERAIRRYPRPRTREAR